VTVADRANDVRRKPEQMLGFIGIHPGIVAVDLSQGGAHANEALLTIVAAASIHSHSHGDHHEG
jgi:predicted methyltransferase